MKGTLPMPLTRRSLLAGAAALPLVAGIGRAATSPLVLTAAEARARIAPPDYPETAVWAYNGQVPGQVLRYRQGDVLDLDFTNALDEPTTVHWHGLRLPNAMDGVPDMTQPPVQPGDAFRYRFALNDAGTFWYHPHVNSLEQLSRGLAGALVVAEAEPPEVDADQLLVLSDWRMTEAAEIHPVFDNRHDMSHAGRLGNYVTVNARPELVLDTVPGSRLRLRLVNTAPARVFRLRFAGLRVWTMALDGMPLAAAAATDEVTIAPAQRADLLVDVTAEAGGEAVVASVERDGTFALASLRVAGPAQALRPDPAPLPPNREPALDLAGARTVPLKMQGGAMRGLPGGAVWQGTRRDMRTLAEAGQFWAFNGIAGLPDEPLLSAGLGETVRIPIANDTAFAHAMHLHGMHFREVLPDRGLGPWRDTLLVGPGETREIAFVADNPGDWMFHCHMPAHMMSGMMNWIRVA